MPDATFTSPDLTTFTRLDDLGPEVTSQLLEPDRAVLEDRTVHVRARITDALGSIQPVPPATLAVSKKWGRHRSRPRLTWTGFQPG